MPRLCRMAADALSGLRYLAPGSAPSQARQAQRRRAITPSAALCRMAADALSGLRYLAPGSAPSQARQAQRRRAITSSAEFVPDGG
ncbi:hypothetical protein DMQ71_02055 [Klebsiella quasipneumoniae]|nr:hypothetical protein DMQ71_02055 [Klebsiella quasipneumoniae]